METHAAAHAQALALMTPLISEELRRHAPFDQMERAPLDQMISHLSLVFYPEGADILTPEAGTPRYFWIIHRGKVLARQSSGVAVTEFASQVLAPGESFPIGALMASRPSTNAYTAQEDTWCYRLPAEEFMNLVQGSPAFQMHAIQYIATLLNQSRQQLNSLFSQRASDSQTMSTPLGQLIKHNPVSVQPDTPLRAALELMHSTRVGSMVIADDERHVHGILTRTDLLDRVVLTGFDLSRPISEVMSVKPQCLPVSASAYDAALMMANHGFRHIVVVDSQERLKGVISERDLFSLQRIGLGQIRASIESSQSIDNLQQASHDIRQLAVSLMTQGIAAEQLTQFISALNDHLTRRILELLQQRHDLAGIEWVWLAFGSEGRHEQTLSTDQDNGILFICPELTDREALRVRLLAFGREVNEALARCGFPLCEGNIMASNPELCLTLDEWKDKFGSWIREPRPDALLNATIFFDFRVLHGREHLGDQLRAYLLSLTTTSLSFLKMLAANALDVEPPLGTFRDFVVGEDGLLDLKVYGSRLFVDCARILALRNDVESTSTIQRLRQAGPRAGIPPEDIDAMIDGFHFIQQLRLRIQSPDGSHHKGSNKIRPDDLNELDRRILKEAFRQAKKLQVKLKLDYQL